MHNLLVSFPQTPILVYRRRQLRLQLILQVVPYEAVCNGRCSLAIPCSAVLMRRGN